MVCLLKLVPRSTWIAHVGHGTLHALCAKLQLRRLLHGQLILHVVLRECSTKELV